jgi:PRC-barrel domain
MFRATRNRASWHVPCSSLGRALRAATNAVPAHFAETRELALGVPETLLACPTAASDRRFGNMLRPTKDILSYKIMATDGEIGSVSDLLVDDSDLRVRYLVIDTGDWLPGKQVILSTAWISSLEPERQLVVMNIEKKRIRESPE